MYKYIATFAILMIMIFPARAHNADRPKNMYDYITEYLTIFDNLEFTEVVAEIQHESKNDQTLVTYESKVHDYSWGGLQVRGRTLRDMGYKGDFHNMLNWKVGLYWGMKYMSICKKRAKRSVLKEYGILDKNIIRKRMFSLYNAGGLYFKMIFEDGIWKKVFCNREYVKRCEYYYQKFRLVYKVVDSVHQKQRRDQV